MHLGDFLAVLNLGHKVYLSPRRTAEREGRLALVGGDGEVATAEDIHTAKDL